MKKIFEYFEGVRQEMMKVTWPSKDEVVSHTALVVVFALVLSVVVGAFDFVLQLLVTR